MIQNNPRSSPAFSQMKENEILMKNNIKTVSNSINGQLSSPSMDVNSTKKRVFRSDVPVFPPSHIEDETLQNVVDYDDIYYRSLPRVNSRKHKIFSNDKKDG
jgi:hypothetical protein